MNADDRIKKLSKAIDDIYSNINMWPHLQRSQQDKLEKLYNDLTFQFVRARRIKREEVEQQLKAGVAQSEEQHLGKV